MLNREEELRFCKARRAAIALDYQNLNPEQRRAALATEGPLLLLAGAGSGKTTVLIHRIANLMKYGRGSDCDEAPAWAAPADLAFLEGYVQNPDPAQKAEQERLCRVDPAVPWSIIAITFTNKAAGELKERLERMLGPSANDIWASTFHSACVRILRRDIDRLGFTSSFTIYDTADSERVIKDIVKDFNLDEKAFAPRSILGYISRAKDAMKLGKDYLQECEKAGDYRLVKIAKVYAEYERRLREANALDFDDIILDTVRLLQNFDDVREYYQKKFRYVLIDEYQDTNNLQYLLASTLAGGYENFCVVGDDDQSIYGWRGAQISNILEFERFFPNPAVIKLEENYRCTAPILDAANALIRHNLGRRDKTLRAHKGGGEAVRLISMPGDAEEAEFIITDIENVRRQEERPWEDFAILFRANTQSRIIEQTLREHKIPYRMVGAQSFFDRKEVKDLISYLATIENPQADEYLLRILNTPPRGISELTSHLAIDWSREHGNSVWAALQDDEFLATLSTRARNSVLEFNDLIARYIDLFQDKETDFGDALEQLIEETGFSEYVTRLCKTEAEIQKRLVSIGDVKASLRNFWQPGKTLRDYLAQVTLDKEDNDDDVENKPGVCLITMHAAKGLEFPVVYLVGLEEGILPHKRSLEDGNCDEERRLLYVGITRAQEKLMLTYCATRLRYGDRMPCQRSSFLSEIPPHLMDYSKWEDLMNAEATEEESGNFFDSLRSMLLEDE